MVIYRSGLVGVATGNDEIKFSSRGSGSVRSISFMHTERLVPVDEPPDDEEEEGELRSAQTQEISNIKSTEGAEEVPSNKETDVASSAEAVESDEVHVCSVSKQWWLITLHACARGNTISSVIIVVVDTKITKSGDLSEL